MCRHLAHAGPSAVTLASVVTEPEHSLLVQSYAPADMRGGGTINADGFGVGFAHVSGGGGDSDPHRSHAVYRNDRPMWTDASFLDLARVVSSETIVAAARSATVGMPISTAACAPFLSPEDGMLFSHNGVVRGWPGSMAALAETLPALALLTLEAATDSALLWALLRARLAAGADVPDAMASLVAEVLAAAPGSRLNLLVADRTPAGRRLVATAVDHALSVRATPEGAVQIASEPLDADPAWRPVPDGSLVVARPGDAGTGEAPDIEVVPLSSGPSPIPTVPTAVNDSTPRT